MSPTCDGFDIKLSLWVGLCYNGCREVGVACRRVVEGIVDLASRVPNLKLMVGRGLSG
jgi:hypothetical protein